MRNPWLISTSMAFFLTFGFAVGGLIYLVRHPHIKVVPVMSEVPPVQSGVPNTAVEYLAPWAVRDCPTLKRVGVPVGSVEPLQYAEPAVEEQLDLGDSLWPVVVIKGHEKVTVMVPRGL